MKTQKIIVSLLTLGMILVSSASIDVKAAEVTNVKFKLNESHYYELPQVLKNRYVRIDSNNRIAKLTDSDYVLKDNNYSNVNLMNNVGYDYASRAFCFFLDNPTVSLEHPYKNRYLSSTAKARNSYINEQDQLKREYLYNINYNKKNQKDYYQKTINNFTVSNGKGYSDYYVDLVSMIQSNPRTKEIYQKNIKQLGKFIAEKVTKDSSNKTNFIQLDKDGNRMTVNDYKQTDNNEPNTSKGDDWNHVVGSANGDLFCRVIYDANRNIYWSNVDYYLLDVYEWPGNRNYSGIKETDLNHLHEVGLARDFGMMGAIHTYVEWDANGNIINDGLSKAFRVYKDGRNREGFSEIAKNLD